MKNEKYKELWQIIKIITKNMADGGLSPEQLEKIFHFNNIGDIVKNLNENEILTLWNNYKIKFKVGDIVKWNERHYVIIYITEYGWVKCLDKNGETVNFAIEKLGEVYDHSNSIDAVFELLAIYDKGCL